MDHRTRTTVRFSVSEEGQNGDSSSSRSIPSGVTPQPDTLTTVNSKLEENSVKSDTTESVQCRVSKVIEALFLTPIVLVLLGFYMLPTIYFINPPLPFTTVSYTC